MMQAEVFINGAHCTGCYQAGMGEDWWMISTFKDGSLKLSTLGMVRNFASAALALEALEESERVPELAIKRIRAMHVFRRPLK